MTVRSFGLEEELLLVEPGNGHPRAVAETALRDIKHADADGDDPGGGADGAAAQSLEFELQRQQLETNTKPCHDLGELGREIGRASCRERV